MPTCFSKTAMPKFHLDMPRIWLFASTLIWYYMHKHRHTAHSGTSRLTHACKYIFTPLLMCSLQLSLLHWMNNSLISKIDFRQCLFCSKIIHLQKLYLLIRCYKIRFFLWNTNNTDRNGANKQNKHTHKQHSEKDNTGNG